MKEREPARSRFTSLFTAFSRLCLFIERYALSLFFLYVGSKEALLIFARTQILAEAQSLNMRTIFPVSTKHALIMGFDFLVGVNLLISRVPIKPPEKLREILVPLLGTFLYLGYAVASHVSPGLRYNLLPLASQNGAAVMGLLVALVGYSVAVWSAIFLGRSFGVFVSVRPIVSDGPYRYVRHPMYLGHALMIVGVLLSAFAPIYIALTALYLSVIVYRARLEDDALSRSSEAYREYVKHTGSFFPRLRDAGQLSSSSRS
jgi:protein-S-isoprenylcysteine O-methyltransferase Ste14